MACDSRPVSTVYLSIMADTRETRAAACEIKFVIDERLAPRIKEWARTHLQPDPHGCGTFRDEYRISTLYFDTRRFDVFHRNDSFGRAKYRGRRYGAADAVFFERKLRKPGLLIKRRTRDEIETLDRLTDGIVQSSSVRMSPAQPMREHLSSFT